MSVLERSIREGENPVFWLCVIRFDNALRSRVVWECSLKGVVGII